MVKLLERCVLARLFVPAILVELTKCVIAAAADFNFAAFQKARREPYTGHNIVVCLFDLEAAAGQRLDEACRRGINDDP